jgi:hypothetical protein
VRQDSRTSLHVRHVFIEQFGIVLFITSSSQRGRSSCVDGTRSSDKIANLNNKNFAARPTPKNIPQGQAIENAVNR